ncbi:MAG: hypothetical protein M1833_000943 [Piccolia ochrophora]|nr:MAG: hypothetical protein M1833_000943 [Piccolia ochrophora]
MSASTSTSTPTPTPAAATAPSDATSSALGVPQQHPGMTPLESALIEEYTRLLGNLNNLSSSLSHLADTPTAEIMDGLRGLERKTSLVFTLLKASVYSIVLQQQIWAGGEDGGDASQGMGEGEDVD